MKFLKIIFFRAGGVAQVVESPPNKHEALSSNSSTITHFFPQRIAYVSLEGGFWNKIGLTYQIYIEIPLECSVA
jgi:hypothetical protein